MDNSQNEYFSKQVHDFLDEFTKKLPSYLIEYLKTTFQGTMAGWTNGESTDLQVKFVIDSNIVIRSLRYYVKTGNTPLLLNLKSNPLFPLYSPVNLDTEVLDYIETKEKNSKYKSKMRKIWKSIKENITLLDNIGIESWNKAQEIIGKRDPDDIPFVGVYFDLNASGIVTDDKDYEHPEIKRFNIESLGDIVGIFHRGLFSFYILNDLTPLLFDFIKQFSLSFLKSLSNILILFLRFIKAIITGAMTKIFELLSNVPSSWLFIGILGIVASGLAISLHDGIRNKIKDSAQSIKTKIQQVFNKIISIMKIFFETLINYAKGSAPYAAMTLTIINEFNQNIKNLQEEFLNLISEESLFSS